MTGEHRPVGQEETESGHPRWSAGALVRCAGRRRGPRRGLAALAAAVLLTWPLARQLGSHVPQGTESASTVPLFNLWTLRWNAEHVLDGWAGIWDAPIFAPATGTFAWSDPQLLTGLVAAPLVWLSGDGVLAYGVVVLAALALNGVAGARLARRVGTGEVPALAIGLLALTLPFVTNELGVLQLTMVFPALFTIEALLAWDTSDRWPDGLRVGLWLSVALLTSSYYGVMLLTVLLLGGGLLLHRGWWSRRRLLGTLAAGAGLLVAAGPLVAQRIAAGSVGWTERTVLANSARASEWLRLPPTTRGAGVVPWTASDGAQALYPGTLLVLLAVVGVVLARRHGGRRWQVVRWAAASGVLAAVLSLGPALDLGGWHPYAALQALLPPLAGLRSPFRFGLLAAAFLLVPAAVAVEWCWQRRAAWVRPAVVLCLVLGVLEVAAPVRTTVVPDVGAEDWNRFLEARDDGGVVAMVPFAPGPSAADFEPTVEAMLAGLEHGHPLLNGYSGHFPDGHGDLRRSLEGFPDPVALEVLRSAGVRWVVVDRTAQPPSRRDELAEARGLQVAYEGEERTVYRLEP